VLLAAEAVVEMEMGREEQAARASALGPKKGAGRRPRGGRPRAG
jgi:hypothetical protein